MIFSLFNYDKRNPFRRTCKKCGQLQEEMYFMFSDYVSPSWWEDNGKIYDESCKCHKKQIYKSL